MSTHNMLDTPPTKSSLSGCTTAASFQLANCSAAIPGIRFNPESDTLSRLFFCIAVPSFAPTAHIGMLQTLAKFARDPKRVEKLLASKQPGIANRYLGSFKG
jgi:hypothetical protein